MIRVACPAECQALDGVVLRGLQWQGDAGWVVLVHDRDGESDLEVWRPLLPSLFPTSWSLLAIDLRGHGASDGDAGQSHLAADLDAWCNHLRAAAADWIAVVSTGWSATAILQWASTTKLDALALLSPMGLNQSADVNLRGAGTAKLFAVGSADADLGEQVLHVRNQSIGWAMVVNVPGTNQGIDLITGDLGPQVKERIVSFLREQRFLSRTRLSQTTRSDGQGKES